MWLISNALSHLKIWAEWVFIITWAGKARFCRHEKWKFESFRVENREMEIWASKKKKDVYLRYLKVSFQSAQGFQKSTQHFRAAKTIYRLSKLIYWAQPGKGKNDIKNSESISCEHSRFTANVEKMCIFSEGKAKRNVFLFSGQARSIFCLSYSPDSFCNHHLLPLHLKHQWQKYSLQEPSQLTRRERRDHYVNGSSLTPLGNWFFSPPSFLLLQGHHATLSSPEMCVKSTQEMAKGKETCNKVLENSKRLGEKDKNTRL